MQMTAEARAWLDSTVRRILARYPLGDAERAGITYELMSHLHSAGEARAAAAGRTEVTKTDLELAFVEAGGDARLAEAFVQPLARPIERVLFARRLAAFAIDAFVLLIVTLLVHSALDTALGSHAAIPADVASAQQDAEFPWFFSLMPWGYHPDVAMWAQALISVVSGAVVLAYFTWNEYHDGRSLGKRVMGIRVMRADGEPMTPRAALVRNVVKLAPVLLIVDTLLMLLVFADAKQRMSDRIADTIVVRSS